MLKKYPEGTTEMSSPMTPFLQWKELQPDLLKKREVFLPIRSERTKRMRKPVDHSIGPQSY